MNINRRKLANAALEPLPFTAPPPRFNPIVTLPDDGDEWFDGARATYSDAKRMWPIWLITKFPLALQTELKGIAV